MGNRYPRKPRLPFSITKTTLPDLPSLGVVERNGSRVKRAGLNIPSTNASAKQDEEIAALMKGTAWPTQLRARFRDLDLKSQPRH